MSGPAAVPGRLEASVSPLTADEAAATSMATTPPAVAREPEGRGELVDVARQTSGPARRP